MLAADFALHIKPIKPDMHPKTCAEMMYDLRCLELPVHRDGNLIGTVDLEECVHTEESTIEPLIEPGVTTLSVYTHLFDILRVFNESRAQTAAVLNEEHEYFGIITKASAMEALAESISIDQTGAIIVLEAAPNQYSSSEIARIVEGEGSQILGLWLEHVKDSGRIRISIKLNTQNAERIAGGLRRFNYEVIASFGDQDYLENVERRYQSLMKYLDL